MPKKMTAKTKTKTIKAKKNNNRLVFSGTLTLDALISAALLARAKSPLGGGTVVHLCEQDREYITCTHAMLDTDTDHPEDGAVFLVCI